MHKQRRVAYFCMEFGLHPELTIYSGGLGVLAGDYMKSAGDLRKPIVGLGVLWDEGYTHQTIVNGRPVDAYEPTPRDALERVDASVAIDLRGETVALQAYRVTDYTNATLYLLEPRDARHRWITRRLYGGAKEERIAQEMVLGIGGVRLLRALGHDVDVYHFNEGHAVFAGHELLREQRAAGASFEQAWRAVREQIVFTTHTPVAAGNESHPLALLVRMGATLDLDREQLEQLGGAPYNMTVAGLRLAGRANAVARQHCETSRAMWRHIEDAAPIVAVTNGVHLGTWQDERVRRSSAGDDDDALWRAHGAAKAELCELVAERAGAALDPDRLVVGFARRAASYKRADLIFGDPDRLERLFVGRRLQLVFSGKAHPRDAAGKRLVAKIVAASARWPGNVVFLENYDMTLGAALTRGCDLWLNNPRPPMEASGTSGMKAAMNGVLNCSVLDGWWPEGCEHGVTGWHIAADHRGARTEQQRDERDRDALLDVLEREVMARYYGDRAGWLRMMRASIAMAERSFSSDRMLEDYYQALYEPTRACA